MLWLYLIVLPTLALVLLFGLKRMLGSNAQRTTYTRKDFLMTPEEKLFFQSLESAVGKDFHIFPKVPVQEVISPRHPVPRQSAWNQLEKLDEAIFPFMLSRKTDLGIACAIQLVGHRGIRNREKTSSDSILKTICLAAGLPLIRIEWGPYYDLGDLRESVAEAIRREPLFFSDQDGRREPSLEALENIDLR